MNLAILTGRITRDVELKHTQTGQAVTRFSVAVDKGLSKDKKAEMESKNQATCDFINIVAWGKTAELIANYMSKGSMIGIQGRIQTGSYDKEGQKVYTFDVVADRIEFLESKGGSNESSNSNSDLSMDSGFDSVNEEDIPF